MKPKKLLKSWAFVFAWVVGLTGLTILCGVLARPVLLQITDQAGPWFLTFSPADIDLDGDLDVLVHNMRRPGEFEAYSGGALWINQGGVQGGQIGQFVNRISDLEGGRDSTLTDLDGDGDPDLLVYDGFLLVIGLNQGEVQEGQAGVFRRLNPILPPEAYKGITQFGSPLAGDINGDGRVDALILGCCGRAFTSDSNASWIWFNQLNADGQFERASIANLETLYGLPVAEASLADLDGDQDLDLFAVILETPNGQGPGPTSLVFLNDGAGNFVDSGQRLEGEDSSSVALGDLDGDGDLDALVGHAQGASMWINQGGTQSGLPAHFIASEQRITGNQTRSLRLADLDGDGDLDAILVGKRRAELWWNNEQGQLTLAGQSLPCNEAQDLTTGDFNADGWVDIFLAEYNEAAWLWLNDGQGTFVAANPD